MAGEALASRGLGSAHSAARRYLARVLNDPGSLELDDCTAVQWATDDDAWLVGCDYRARYAFGGIVRQSHWFLIHHGNVVEMKPAAAYNH